MLGLYVFVSTIRWCPWTATYYNLLLQAQHLAEYARGGDVVRLLVDERNPELELSLQNVMRPLCRRDITILGRR